MTPEQEAMFRERLAAGRPRAPAVAPDMPLPMTGTAADPNANDFLPRTQRSLGRLYDNPAIQGVGRMMDPTGATGLGIRGVEGLASMGGARQPTSFTREMEGGPQHMTLDPMASGPELTMPSTPTLDQHYGRTAPGSAGGSGGSGGLGGPGGGGMAGLARDYKQAQLSQFGTLDRQRDLVERSGELVSERIDKQAELQELEAARKQRDAEVMAAHQAQAEQKHDAFLARNQELADQIGSEKIDPSRVFAEKGAGEKIMLLIAGALNGAAGQGPQFMSRLDNMVSEGVKAQMANADGLKSKLAARQNLFGQMMAESGDRRVAEMQTRNLMLESVKQNLGARAARLGIPEVTQNAEITMNEIEEKKQNPLREHLTGEALRSAQAQAAAAAGAQRQAEEKAYQRQKDLLDYGLKRDAQQIEIAKLEGKDKDDVNAETSKLSAALSDPKLASGRAAVEASKRRLGIAEDGTVMLGKDGKPVVDQKEGLPGVGPNADLRDKLGSRPEGLNVINPFAWALHKGVGLSADERVSRGDWDKMALDYQVRVTGSGGSEEQMRQIKAAFAGAKTAQEQRNAVAEADAVYRQIESRTKAGVSPRALSAFEARLKEGAPSMPGSVTVKR